MTLDVALMPSKPPFDAPYPIELARTDNGRAGFGRQLKQSSDCGPSDLGYACMKEAGT